jgi:hypothetical protein
MPPFSIPNQLVDSLDAGADAPAISTVPGHPAVSLKDSFGVRQFLERELCCEDLETMAPRLWIMTTASSANISPLHRQRVKGREIIVTEEARLHLVWIYDRIFIKPLPLYLLSHAFWEIYLDSDESKGKIRKAALGYLRTYRYLIKHESDFHIAQQDSLRLIPKDVDWSSFCRFISELDRIEDRSVSGRYCYGELRLTRLNIYAPLLLGKFYFEQVHGQYGDIFGRLYGPVLFVFALASTILNSMQVALAVDQLVDAAHWRWVWYLSRWFSAFSLVGTTIISTWFILLWLWLFADEWIFTIRRRMERKKSGDIPP